jgi:hypothetical protein
MRALPVTADDYPEERVNEQSAALHGIELTLIFLRQAIETGESENQLRSERWESDREERLKQEGEEYRKQVSERRARQAKEQRSLDSISPGSLPVGGSSPEQPI